MKNISNVARLCLAGVVLCVIGFLFLNAEKGNITGLDADLSVPDGHSMGNVPSQLISEKYQPAQLSSSLSLTRDDKSKDEIDYFSYENLMSHFASQSASILEAYKGNELKAKTDAAAQYALTLPLRRCDLPTITIQSQNDLDLFIAERDQKFVFEESTQHLLNRAAKCAALNDYLTGTDLFETFLTHLMAAVESGYPMALVETKPLSRARKGEISIDEAYSTFANAYTYSAEYPEYRVLTLRTVLSALKGDGNKSTTYKAMGALFAVEVLVVEDGVDLGDARLMMLEALDERLLPNEVDMILNKMDSLQQAMEQGDWSFLGGAGGT